MRCDILSLRSKLTLFGFQSTHLHEVWLNHADNSFNFTGFQSTHLHEVWLIVGNLPAEQFMFQSTHLHEVWRSHSPTMRFTLCFNPHTYMRCDFMVKVLDLVLAVSIHTPTWGVTVEIDPVSKFCIVSIHTPTWGVTFDYLISYVLILFQSTHLHEVWPITPFFYLHSVEVSIHTPTWGVTKFIVVMEKQVLFQSTHLHEVWLNCLSIQTDKILFQSTHLHEVWLLWITRLTRWTMFQSTHLHEVWPL